MAYAERTSVPVDQSKMEIEKTLTKYGAKSFGYFSEGGRAVVVFEANARRIRFDLPLPAGDTGKEAQIKRQRWRALLLCVKAKLESVEAKIETFEEAFLAHVVMPDGQTVMQVAAPRIKQAYDGGKMLPLLPGPGGDK
jgi:hypothetical protein